MQNRVVQTVTKDGVNPVTMDELLKEALRFHPYAIIPAEMRGGEALTAVEAGRTGHTIISTLHANSAVDAYNRILSMCVSTGVRLSENKLLEFILEAMPLVLFKRQLPDGRRVYDEIFEGVGIADGKVVGNTLWKYEVIDNVYDDSGKILSRTKPLNDIKVVESDKNTKEDTYCVDVLMDEDFDTSQILVTVEFGGKATSFNFGTVDSDEYYED